MIVLGLTGSIGMGKTTAAGLLRRLGLPVFNADLEVHRLMAPGGPALRPIAAEFPGVVHRGGVDRKALGAAVFRAPEKLRRLEAIIHPMIRARQRGFLQAMKRARHRVVVLDVPLLFEGGAYRLCDAVLVVSAPATIQRARVLRRAGMTPEKLDGILAQQMPDAEKRQRADFVIPTGRGRPATLRALRRAVRIAISRGSSRPKPPWVADARNHP